MTLVVEEINFVAPGTRHRLKLSRRNSDVKTDDKPPYAEVRGVAAIAKRHSNVVGVEVLPYHRFGEYKWGEMGLRYPLEGMETPSLHTITRVKKMFEALGVKVIL